MTVIGALVFAKKGVYPSYPCAIGAAFQAAVEWSRLPSAEGDVLVARAGGSSSKKVPAKEMWRVVEPEIDWSTFYWTEGEAVEALDRAILNAKATGNKNWEYGGLTVKGSMFGPFGFDEAVYYNTKIVTSQLKDEVWWSGPHLSKLNSFTPIGALHHYHPLSVGVVPKSFSPADTSLYKAFISAGFTDFRGLYLVDDYGTRVYRGGKGLGGIACTQGVAAC